MYVFEVILLFCLILNMKEPQVYLKALWKDLLNNKRLKVREREGLLLVASVVSDSVRPHRWQPTRLPHPWYSPGKNTGVGCHFLLRCLKVKSESEVTQSCPTLSDPMDCSLPGSSIHGIFQARVLEWGAIAFSKREGLTDGISFL